MSTAVLNWVLGWLVLATAGGRALVKSVWQLAAAPEMLLTQAARMLAMVLILACSGVRVMTAALALPEPFRVSDEMAWPVEMETRLETVLKALMKPVPDCAGLRRGYSRWRCPW